MPENPAPPRSGPPAIERLRAVFDSVSTRPLPSSYIWNGQRSLLAWTTFHLFYVLRLLSPLQWFKYFARRRVSRRLTTNLRPDFAASYTEGYFLAVGIGAALVWYCGDRLEMNVPGVIDGALWLIGAVLFLETFTWIFYYLLIRAFVEGRFTIFHPSEYLLTLPIVLVAQVLLLRELSGRQIGFLVSSLTGTPVGTGALTLALACLGLVYIGVTIVVLMSSHPGISTRRSQHVAVIGAGDVTVNRILPALSWLGYKRTDITVATTPDGPPIPPEVEGACRLIVGDERKLLTEVCRQGAPTVIGTPTHAHFSQMIELASDGIPFAVEKPIVSSAYEREALRANGERVMSNGFALSYYTLEKSLPLTYLMQPLPVYEQFLEWSPQGALGSRNAQRLRDALGAVESVHVVIHEGPDRSPQGHGRLWTQVPGGLRPFVETTIHPLLVIRRIVGPGSVDWTRIDLARNEPRAAEVRRLLRDDRSEISPTYIATEGWMGATRVSMSVGKYLADAVVRRGAIVNCVHGRIECDFDRRELTVSLGDRSIEPLRLSVKESPPYAVLLQLFTRFALKGWGPIRFDDYERQLDALDWWDDICDRAEYEGLPTASYDEVPPDRSVEVLAPFFDRSAARSPRKRAA